MPKRKRLVKITLKRGRKKKQDDDAFDDSVLPDFSTAQSLAGFIEGATDILGDVDTTTALENLSYTNKKYNAEKTRVINRFYKIVSFHPSLTTLTESVTDPEQENGERITRFVLLCRGVRTKPKKRIVNTCMMLVAQNLRKKDASSELNWSDFWVDKKNLRRNMRTPATSQTSHHCFTASYLNISTTREFCSRWHMTSIL